MITLLYKKTLRTSMLDKKFDKKEDKELKKIYNHYPDKIEEIMEKTEFKIEKIFGDVFSTDSVSLEQLRNLIVFSEKNVNINIKISFCFLNLERKKK